MNIKDIIEEFKSKMTPEERAKWERRSESLKLPHYQGKTVPTTRKAKRRMSLKGWGIGKNTKIYYAEKKKAKNWEELL